MKSKTYLCLDYSLVITIRIVYHLITNPTTEGNERSNGFGFIMFL